MTVYMKFRSTSTSSPQLFFTIMLHEHFIVISYHTYVTVLSMSLVPYCYC